MQLPPTSNVTQYMLCSPFNVESSLPKTSWKMMVDTLNIYNGLRTRVIQQKSRSLKAETEESAHGVKADEIQRKECIIQMLQQTRVIKGL